MVEAAPARTTMPKGFQKKKCNVVMEIRKAHVAVTEPQTLKVTWSRSNKSLSTKGKSVDGQSKVATFGERFSCDANLRFDPRENIWLPDPNELTLECGSRRVGTIKFDISSLIDVPAQSHKVMLRPETYSTRDETELVMKGNTVDFPGAFIEFKVTVKSPEAADGRASVLHRMSGAMSARNSSSMGGTMGIDEHT